MVKYVTVKKFARESGYSEDAIRTKMRDGVWQKNKVWVKALDGRILIDIGGYHAWVECSLESKPSPLRPSRSLFSTEVRGAAKGSSSSPPPLI